MISIPLKHSNVLFLQNFHRQRRMEERNCKWFSELLWVKGSNARNSIQSSSWCWGRFWFCEFRGCVWDRPRWGAHHTSSGSQSEVRPPSAPVGDGRLMEPVVGRAENVLLWGPFGWRVGFLIAFGSLYQMNYRTKQITF